MTVKDTVLCLCELGWLYSKVSTYISSCEKATVSRGLAVQAFTYALQEELHDYYRLLAVLEQELARKIANNENSKSGNSVNINNNSNYSNGSSNINSNKNYYDDNNGSNGQVSIGESRRFNTPSQNKNQYGNQALSQGQGPTGAKSHDNESNSTTWVSSVDANATSGLTLLRLKAWMQDPLDRMCIMARLVDSAAPLTGGIIDSLICTTIYYNFNCPIVLCSTLQHRPSLCHTIRNHILVYLALLYCIILCHN